MESEINSPDPLELCELDSLSSVPSSGPLADQDSGEHDIFIDASADAADHKIISLDEAFADCEKAMKLFFNNDLDGAMAIMSPWATSSMYHSLGTAIFSFIPAVLTLEPKMLKEANGAVKSCIAVCNAFRKNHTLVESLGSIIKKPNCAAYSDLEAHAELCYAEALLLNSALSVLEGEDIGSLIRTTIKIKNCYSTYQYCWDIKSLKTWNNNVSKLHFKSGVRLGIATFNLMISLMPPRIISILEFVGFSANKSYGLAELEKGSRCPGIRAVLCDMTLLAYNLVICQFVGGQGDLDLTERILNKNLTVYPKSEWFLVFKGRYHFLRGQLDEAICTYREVVNTADDKLRPFRQLCYWELMWIYGLLMDYRQAAEFAEMLINGTAWSKTTHCYIKAALLMQAAGDRPRSDYGKINKLIIDAPTFKTRLVGKSIPMEKFIIKRCERFWVQKHRLVLPVFELICIWNLLPVLANNREQLHNIMKVIERNTELLDTCEGEWWSGHKADNKALLLYMHGCCLVALNLPRSAIQKFYEVLALKRQIKGDIYLLPFAICDMGWCYYKLGDMKKAHNLLTDAKKNYTKYDLEPRLHFRVHTRLQTIREIVGNTTYVKEFH